MLILIDNYDSFVYNLAQYFGELGEEVTVVRNDAADIVALESFSPTRLVISPGPCTPDEAGISLAAAKHFAGRIPVLGVCLGHQCIGQAFGGTVAHALQLMHGKTSKVIHDGEGVFRDLPSPFVAARYHSLSLAEKNLPKCFEISARADGGEIMGIRHREFAVAGVQFHPESLFTEHGHALLQNFLELT